MKIEIDKITKDEIEYLYWFRINADFGPADSDVKHWMNNKFEKEQGKSVPKGWKDGENE